jgi:hypothetical protein
MVEPEVDTEESQVAAPAQAIAESKVLEQLMARRADPEQTACAESLVGFARAAHADLDDADQRGITISSNKTLQIEEQGNQVAMPLTIVKDGSEEYEFYIEPATTTADPTEPDDYRGHQPTHDRSRKSSPYHSRLCKICDRRIRQLRLSRDRRNEPGI